MERTMKILQNRWLPLVMISLITVAALVISVISLIFGWQTIFQNLFYFPIILACIYYIKRGLVFSVVLACCYFVLMAMFSQDPVVLEGAFVRVLFFILVAGVITYLSMVRGRAEDSQRESETRLTEIIDFLPDPTFVIDTDGKVIAWNYAIANLLGVAASEIIGKGNYEHAFRMFGNRRPVLIDLVIREDDAVIKKHYPDLHRERGMLMAELDIPSLRGRHTALWIIATPLYNAKGEITGAIESMRDITHIHDTEEELRESQQMLSDIIDFLPDPTFAIDTSGAVIAWNRAIEVMLGISKADMLGKSHYAYSVPFYGTIRPSLIDLVLKQDLEVEAKYSTLLRKGDQLIAEVFIKNLNGGKGEYLWLIASPLYERNGTVRGAIESIRTITDRKRAEEAFKETNKKLNLLSSITRHDINNQLTVLLGYLDIIEEQQPNPTLLTYCQKASGAAKRITTMIQFTKTYESIGVNEPAWQDSHALVETAVKDIALGKIQIVNDLPPGTEIYADPLIIKVFYNLMDNAVKYGGESTTSIRFSSHESDVGLAIVCEDDGAGISPDDKKHLFERGFGKNTGLGLFLSREILAITGMTIHENCEPGKGARFEINVPKGAWRMAGTDTDDVHGRKP